MAALNFPTTNLVAGVTEYSANGTTYVWDGVKWVGRTAGGAAGTNSIQNNGNTVQVNADGDLVLPAYTLPNTAGTEAQVLTWPAGGTVLEWTDQSGGSTYTLPAATANELGGVKLGEGLDIANDNKVTVNKLYSTNNSDPNVHYRLTLDNNGVVVLPDQSIINGSTLRGIYGTGEANFTGITIGPDADHREESWVWVDKDGAHVAARYSGDISTAKQWDFKNDGNLQLPADGYIVNSSGQNILAGLSGGSTYSNTNVAAYLTGNITTGNVNATQYNFANGVNILSTVTGGGNANTGNFTFDADTISNDNGLKLATDRGTLAIGVNLEVPGYAQHFHVAFDQSNSIPPNNDLFLGDDYNYVKLPGFELNPNNPYGVEIGTNDRDGGDDHVWRFGTDGNLQLPQGSRISDQSDSVDITVGRVSESAYWYNLFGDTGVTGVDNYANTAINGSVVHDSGGNVYVLGSTIDWNNGLGSNNLFLKYSPEGRLLWRRTWTDDNGLNCGSFNASLRYIEANVDLGTQDTIVWAAQVPWDKISYIGTMDMEGNLVDQFGNARLPTRLDNFAVIDLEWFGSSESVTNSGVYVVGQQYIPGPALHLPTVAGVDLANAAVIGTTTVVPNGSNLGYGDPNNSPQWVNQFKSTTTIPAWQSNPAVGALLGTYYDGDWSHAMVALSANGPPLTYGIGVQSHLEEDIIGEDICADANGNVYIIVNNLDSNYATLVKASAYSLDESYTLFQLKLGSEDPDDNFYASAVAYDNGYVYVLGQFYQENIDDTDAMLIKVAIFSGNIVWSRRIGSPGDDGVSFFGGAGWESSSVISIQDGLIVMSLATEARTPGLGGPPELNTVTLQYPTDGSITGTYGDFVISDFVPAYSSGNYSVTLLNTSLGSDAISSGFATLLATTATVGTGWTNTQWDLEQNREVLDPQTWRFNYDGSFDTAEIKHQTEVKITANTTVANATPSTWTFQNNDGLRFPDGSVQYGAYVQTEMSLDGGSAATVYNIISVPPVADGGGSASRFGNYDPVYDGSNGDNYVLDGGGA